MTSVERILSAKNIIAEERRKADNHSWHSHLLTKQFEFEAILPNIRGRKILELGSAGHMLTTRIFLSWGLDVHLVDMEDRTKEHNYPDGITFYQSDWYSFQPSEGADYSDIFFIHGLEHIENGIPLLKKIKDWMTPDTVFHLIVPNALSFHRMIGAEMGMLKTPYSLNENDVRNGHKKMYSMKMLEKAVTEAGFSIISKKGIQFKPLTDGQLYQVGDEYINAVNRLSDIFTEYCSEIYICAGV